METFLLTVIFVIKVVKGVIIILSAFNNSLSVGKPPLGTSINCFSSGILDKIPSKGFLLASSIPPIILIAIFLKCFGNLNDHFP